MFDEGGGGRVGGGVGWWAVSGSGKGVQSLMSL